MNKSFVFCCVLISMLFLFAGQVSGQSYCSLWIDHVDGLDDDGNIPTGQQITIYWRLTNPTSDYIKWFAYRHYITSSGGTSWGSSVHQFIDPPDWDPIYSYIPTLLYYPSGDGYSPDTLLAFHTAMGGCGVPGGFDAIIYKTVLGPISDIYAGETITIETQDGYYGGNGSWNEMYIELWDGYNLETKYRDYYYRESPTFDIVLPKPNLTCAWPASYSHPIVACTTQNSFEYEVLYAGEQAYISYAVTNDGDAPAGYFYCYLYVDGQFVRRDDHSGALNPGETWEVHDVPYTYNYVNEYVPIRVFIDPPNWIDEIDESYWDNNPELEFPWEERPKANLTIKWPDGWPYYIVASTSPDTHFDDDLYTNLPIYFDFAVQNDGLVTSEPCKVRFTVDGTEVGIYDCPSLVPGQSWEFLDKQTQITTSKFIEAEVEIDWEMDVDESDETDNTYSEWFFVDDPPPVCVDGWLKIENPLIQVNQVFPHLNFEILGVNGTDTTVLDNAVTYEDGWFSSVDFPYSQDALHFRFTTDQSDPLMYVYRYGFTLPIKGVLNLGENCESSLYFDSLVLRQSSDLHNTSCFPALRIIRDAYSTDSIFQEYGVDIDRNPIFLDTTSSLTAGFWSATAVGGLPAICLNQSDYVGQWVCHELGHQVCYQVHGYEEKPPSPFDGTPHGYPTPTDTLLAFNEGFAEFIHGISSRPESLYIVGWQYPNENLEDNQWYLSFPSYTNQVGEIVEGAVASILFDLYDDGFSPEARVLPEEDGVDDHSFMMPIILDCIRNYSSADQTWSLGEFGERLVRTFDANAPWSGDQYFKNFRPAICDIFSIHHFTDAINTNDYCVLSGTGVTTDEPAGLPQSFSVSQNYPNPFNGSTEIFFTTARRADCEIQIYNLLGQVIYSYDISDLNPGYHCFHIDDEISGGWASGVYFYRVQTGDDEKTKKMLLLK